jgi:hypothetical protein
VTGGAVRGGQRSGVWVRLVSNETPVPSSSLPMRSGRLVMGVGVEAPQLRAS